MSKLWFFFSSITDRPPTNIRGGGGRTGDLTVVWDRLPRQHHNAPGIYYRVYYRRVGVEEEIDFQQKTLKSLGKYIFVEFLAAGLQPAAL